MFNTTITLALGLVGAATASIFADPQFIWLGASFEGHSLAVAVSGNAEVIVGRGDESGLTRAAEWGVGFSPTLYGVIPGGEFSLGIGVSDTRLVVGVSGTPNGRRRAVLWRDEVMDVLNITEDIVDSECAGVSADGNWIAGMGQRSNGQSAALLWSGSGQLLTVSAPTVGALLDVRDVNNDGWMAASVMTSGTVRPALLSQSTSFLLPMPIGGLGGEATSLAASGYDAAGYVSLSPQITVAVRWANGQVESLGHLPGDTYSYARSISDDGQTVVGFSRGSVADSDRAFLWHPDTGMIDLEALVSSQLPTGFRLIEARGVSGDGTLVVGWGVLDGVQEAWAIRIPGACSGALMIVAGCFGIARRRSFDP